MALNARKKAENLPVCFDDPVTLLFAICYEGEKEPERRALEFSGNYGVSNAARSAVALVGLASPGWFWSMPPPVRLVSLCSEVVNPAGAGKEDEDPLGVRFPGACLTLPVEWCWFEKMPSIPDEKLGQQDAPTRRISTLSRQPCHDTNGNGAVRPDTGR